MTREQIEKMLLLEGCNAQTIPIIIGLVPILTGGVKPNNLKAGHEPMFAKLVYDGIMEALQACVNAHATDALTEDTYGMALVEERARVSAALAYMVESIRREETKNV